MATIDQDIHPGDIYTRDEIISVLGGTKYAGICPSVDMNAVILYSDDEAGAEFGYRDGWVPADEDDGIPEDLIFEYTGAGREGDQSFVGRTGWPNSAVLHHAEVGRTLHLFVAEGKVPGTDTTLQRYVGQFALNERCSFVVRAARDKNGRLRRVIVFRLQPAGAIQIVSRDKVLPAPTTQVELVPASVTTAQLVEPERGKTPVSRRAEIAATHAEHREAALSEMLEQQLKLAKHHVGRYQIHVKGRFTRLLTDLYDETAHILYELKGDNRRESVRMALGQLFDYSRFVNSATHAGPPRLVIALPEPPEDDLRDLLAERNVQLTYPVDGSFINLPL